jgi:hypothetical protein
MPGVALGKTAAPSPSYVTEFLSTSDGLAFVKAFVRIKEPKIQRHIVQLVQEIAVNDRIRNVRAHRL